MVAFNFQPDFADDILADKKRSTIRSKRRCNLGDTMHLFTGQRTKHCRKLAERKCIGLAQIVIGKEEEGNVIPWAIKGGYEGTPLVAKRLCNQEGFINEKEMMDFFREKYGLPYTGWLHTWEGQQP